MGLWTSRAEEIGARKPTVAPVAGRRTMKVGDLVRKKEGSMQAQNIEGIGLIIKVFKKPNGYGATYRVRWAMDYGTFWHTSRQLEVLSESR